MKNMHFFLNHEEKINVILQSEKGQGGESVVYRDINMLILLIMTIFTEKCRFLTEIDYQVCDTFRCGILREKRSCACHNSSIL